jgi:large subunit ribosomal protein L19
MAEKKEKSSLQGASKEEMIDSLVPGMTVKIYQKIKELNIKGEEKERIQFYEGLIISKKHGKERGATITVRKITDGVGVEKIFPLNLPSITKIELKRQVRVRRAKLNFLKKNYKKKLKEIKPKAK